MNMLQQALILLSWIWAAKLLVAILRWMVWICILFFYSNRESVSFARVISEKTGGEIENINKSHGGSCVKCRVKPPEVAPAATALRKQELIQEVDTKKRM